MKEMKRISLITQIISALAIVLGIAVGSFMSQAVNLPWHAWLMWAMMMVCMALLSLAAFFGGDRA